MQDVREEATGRARGAALKGGTDIQRLALLARRALPATLAATLAAALLLMGLLAALRLGLPQLQTFQAAVQMQFPGVDRGEYPNGTRFNVGDLVAPAVLSRVHAGNNLAQLGISYEDFASFITVQQYLVTYDDVVARYRERLGDRKLSFGERQLIEQQLVQELERQGRQSALLRLTVRKRLGIPEPLGAKLLSDIATQWANYSINDLGVLALPEAVEQKPAIEPAAIAGLDLPVTIERLMAAHAELASRIARLAAFDKAPTIVDRKSGHTVRSLQRALAEFHDFTLTFLIARVVQGRMWVAPELTRGLLAQRITQREREISALQRRITDAEAALENLREARRSETTTGAASAEADTTSRPTGPERTGAVVGDQFLDRLIQFVERGLDKEGRAELRRRQTAIRDGLAGYRAGIRQLEVEMDRTRQIIAWLDAEGSGRVPAPAAEIEATRRQLDTAVGALNEHWAAAGRLFEAISPRALSFTGQMFTPVDLPHAQRYQVWHPVFNGTIFGLLLAALTATAVGAFTLAFLWQLARARGAAASD